MSSEGVQNRPFQGNYSPNELDVINKFISGQVQPGVSLKEIGNIAKKLLKEENLNNDVKQILSEKLFHAIQAKEDKIPSYIKKIFNIPVVGILTSKAVNKAIGIATAQTVMQNADVAFLPAITKKSLQRANSPGKKAVSKHASPRLRSSPAKQNNPISPNWAATWNSMRLDNNRNKVWTIGNGPKGSFDWKNPAILSFGTWDRMQGANPRQKDQMARHGRVRGSGYLSNYHMRNITVDGETFKSVEHYYQAMKFPKGSRLYKYIKEAPSADEARSRATKNSAQGTMPNDTVAAGRMKKALLAKYTHADGRPNELGRALMATGDRLLIEGNNRGDKTDTRWGAKIDFTQDPPTVTGANMLGQLLMELRTELQQSQ